jgi:HK97 family phage major capsid protein
MNVDEMNLQQVTERLAAWEIELRDAKDIDAVNALGAEKELLEARKAELEELETRKQTALDITSGKVIPKIIETRKDDINMEFEKMTRDEILASPEYRSAWLKNMQGKALNEIEQRAYSSTVAAAAIPTQTSSIFFDKMTKIAPMLNEITLLHVAGNVKFVSEGTRNAAAKHTELNAETPAADTLAYVELGAYEYMKLISISKTAQAMTLDAFEGWLLDMLAEDIAIAIEDAVINGDGDGDPKGIEYANTWADNTNGIDYGEAVTYDDILDLIALLPARYDSNAKFLMNKAMFYQQIAKIRDAEGDPIVTKDFSAAVPLRILGYPVIISDKVGTGAAYLGDFKKVVGNMPLDMQVASAENFRSAAVDYRGLCAFDCDVALADAIVKLFT